MTTAAKFEPNSKSQINSLSQSLSQIPSIFLFLISFNRSIFCFRNSPNAFGCRINWRPPLFLLCRLLLRLFRFCHFCKSLLERGMGFGCHGASGTRQTQTPPNSIISILLIADAQLAVHQLSSPSSAYYGQMAAAAAMSAVSASAASSSAAAAAAAAAAGPVWYPQAAATANYGCYYGLAAQRAAVGTAALNGYLGAAGHYAGD
jgi:hypothetical protein